MSTRADRGYDPYEPYDAFDADRERRASATVGRRPDPYDPYGSRDPHDPHDPHDAERERRSSAAVDRRRAVVEPHWSGAIAAPEDVGGSGPEPRRRRRRLRALTGIGAVTAVAVAGGAVATGVIGGTSNAATPHSTLPPSTATVKKTTLTQTESVSGTLGYGSTSTASGGGAGTVTWLAALGDTVAQGKPLYRLDDKPVTLLYGVLPLFRTLTVGTVGADVKEFEADLAALGYTGFTVGSTFTADTATAVKKWQAALGRDQTGTVDPKQVVVAPAAIRIAAVHATVGSPAAGAVLDYTGTSRQVTVALAVSKEGLVKAGDKVSVTLPDGSSTAGTVSKVGRVATSGSSGGSGSGSGGSGSGSGSSTVEVDITLTDENAGAALDQAPVDVDITSGQAKDVLAVPVSALVALAEGGYGVQVVQGSTTKYVPVKPGMFAGGMVEISGDGIAVGTVVGVPNE